MREAIRGANVVEVLVTRRRSHRLPLSLEGGSWSVWKPRYFTNDCCMSISGRRLGEDTDTVAGGDTGKTHGAAACACCY
jgi:hypothetical protein